MALLSAERVTGVSKASLDALLAAVGEGAISAQARYDALARYEELPVRAAIKPGRDWKHDLAKLDLSAVVPFGVRGPEHDEVDDLGGLLAFTQVDNAPVISIAAREMLSRRGVVIEHFSKARTTQRELFEKAFGRAVDSRDDRFASLALAFQAGGVFIAVPEGVQVEEPIVVAYEPRDAAVFPYTLVYLGAGAQATIVERFVGEADGRFVCGIAETVLADGARLCYAVDQRLAASAKAIVTRRATVGKDSSLELALAELGAALSVSRVRVTASAPGARASVTGAFFANDDQHVDLETEVVHAAPNTQSQTLVRSAGTGRGQGRYLGNIKILAHAHGADAALKDDALLLSPKAHVDSVPALEIAANDVKAYHGATVGAISEDELFYAQSRGLPRAEAEQMIALGFFEPALARFPGEVLRDELRTALANKLAPTVVEDNA